jgi:hypothetical protein
VSREDFIAVASRLFSIYILFNIIRSAPSAAQMLWQDQGMTWVGLYVCVLIVGLLLCAFLRFFPLTVARKLLPVMREPRSEGPIGFPTALSLGLTLIGAWLFANALVDATYWLTLFVRSKQIGNIPVEWTPEQIASMIATLVELTISFWLLFGSSGIRQLIFKFRYGATQGAP